MLHLDDTTTTAVIGDTIIVEVAFRNLIKHDNPGLTGEAEGWAGEKPLKLILNRSNKTRVFIK